MKSTVEYRAALLEALERQVRAQERTAKYVKEISDQILPMTITAIFLLGALGMCIAT